MQQAHELHLKENCTPCDLYP